MAFSHDDTQLAGLPDHASNSAETTVLKLAQGKSDIVAPHGDAIGEHDGILDGLAPALAQVRSHRVGGITDQCDLPLVIHFGGGRKYTGVGRSASSGVRSSSVGMGSCQE